MDQDSSALKPNVMIYNNGLSLSEMCKADVVAISDKKFLSLLGGGQSLFYTGSEFLILVAQPREHEWAGGKYKGAAFMVMLPNGEVDWVGVNRLCGGLGLPEAPKSTNIKEEYAAETKWYYATDPTQEAETWGLGKIFKQGFGDNQAPKAVIHIKVDKTWKLWGAAPSKAKQAKSAYVFKKDVKAWDGQVSFASPELVQQYFEKYCALHSDGNVVKEKGLLG